MLPRVQFVVCRFEEDVSWVSQLLALERARAPRAPGNVGAQTVVLYNKQAGAGETERLRAELATPEGGVGLTVMSYQTPYIGIPTTLIT